MQFSKLCPNLARYSRLNNMAWWKNKQLWPAFWVLGCLLLVALARDILANGRPLYCRIQGETFYPGLRTVWTDPDLPYHHPVLDSIQSNFLWRRFPYEAAVFAPVPFSPGELPMSPDTTVLSARPGAVHPGPQPVFRHWLGTDSNGYDIAAGLVSGARVAVLTGLLASAVLSTLDRPTSALVITTAPVRPLTLLTAPGTPCTPGCATSTVVV